MVFLLTVGSFLHSAFDMTIWYLMACYCCRPGGPCQGAGDDGRRSCQSCGAYAALLAVLAAIVAATFVAVARLDRDLERTTYAEDLAADRLGVGGDDGQARNDNLTFAVGYALELGLALFVFYFFTSTVFFSGVLGCGRVPVLGGRPYELWRAGGSKGGGGRDDVGDEDDEDVGFEVEGEEGMTVKAYEV